MSPAQQPLLTLHACQGHLIGQCQGMGVGDLQTPGHPASIVQGAAHLLCDLGVGERQCSGQRTRGPGQRVERRKAPPPTTPPYPFGPEEGVLLDGPGTQCHTTLADGSLYEALVVGREGLQYTEVLSPASPHPPTPRLQGSAKDTPHVSSSPAPPHPHHLPPTPLGAGPPLGVPRPAERRWHLQLIPQRR